MREQWNSVACGRLFVPIKFTLMIVLASCGLYIGCASRSTQVDLSGTSLISPRSQENVRSIVSCVVGVVVVVDYRLEFFHHELVGGNFAPDPTSPTGYLLAKKGLPITVAKKIQKVNGGGLIIYRDDRKTLILTSGHILESPDTLRTFHLDSLGNDTKVLSSRAIKQRATYHVVDQLNQMQSAEVLRIDTRSDLGLVTVASAPALGLPFSYPIAYQTEVKWGDLAFVFGYPREIKQLTVGLISPAPYPGAFALNVVGRYGFSGGPVFVIRPGGELELAGIIRGVPVSKLRYLAPPPEVLPSQRLSGEDFKKITAEEYDLIEYGMVYAVGAEKIGRFLKESARDLERRGIFLPNQFLP